MGKDWWRGGIKVAIPSNRVKVSNAEVEVIIDGTTYTLDVAIPSNRVKVSNTK